MKLVGAGIVAAALMGVGGALAFRVSTPTNTLEVAFQGCARVAEGPVCYLEPGHSVLRLWTLADASTPFDVRIDGSKASVVTRPAAGGVRLELREPRPGRLTVVRSSAQGVRRWAIALRADVRSDALKRVLDAEDAGDLKGLRGLAAKTEGRARIRALLALARAARKDANPSRAVSYQGQAAELAAAAGEWSLASDARFARAFTLSVDLFQLEEAHRELDLVSKLADRVPAVTAYVPYYRALVHAGAGDITSMLADLREAGRQAEALGLHRLASFIEERRAVVDQGIGNFEAALARYRARLAYARANDAPCDEARAATNLGWTLILQRDRRLSRGRTAATATDAVSLESPEDPLHRALELYMQRCDEPDGPPIVKLNLAFAALQAGDPGGAEYWLKQVQLDSLPRRDRPWIEETRARIALARGDLPAAKRWADAQIEVSRDVAGTDNLYRAQVLAADALTRLGRLDEAMDLRQQAEGTLDRLAVSVPLVGARHGFLTVRDENVIGLADLWLRRDRPDQALKAVRRARSRTLGWARVSQGLLRLPAAQRAQWNTMLGEYRRLRSALDRDVEDDWKRSQVELVEARKERAVREARLTEILARALGLLPALPKQLRVEPDVLRLGWIQLGPEVVVLGQLGTDAFAVPWDTASGRLPEAVGRRLAKADQVLLHPYGHLRTRDLHMLRWRGRPLAAQVPTAYAVDLSAGAAPAPRRALVVVDPANELRHGEAEARLVKGALEASGVPVTTLRGDVADLRAQLGGADWFHFGGHGRWSPDDPLAGGLALADGARLGLGDILAAPSVPSTVVLTSCEAGRGAGRGGEAFGLAHAFLVAGARIVVAPDRVVRDEEAFRFAEAFYQASGSAAERYRAAIAALGDDASAFRLFVP